MHTGLGCPSLPLFTICKVEGNITPDSSSGNQTPFPVPEARVGPKLHVQVPWQEAPLDHGQAQGWGSEFLGRREPGFPPRLHLINSHRPPNAVHREWLPKGSWHHTDR